MLPIAEQLRRATGLPIATGWMITDPQQADSAIREGQCDLVLLAREMLRDPHWPVSRRKSVGDG